LAGGFDLVSHYQPTGDQPLAISALLSGVHQKRRDQVLLGVSG
jgi:excinuclease ABC subunit B